MGWGRGVTWPAMEEMWRIDFGGRGGGLGVVVVGGFLLGEEERKWERASWVVRIGWVRLMSRVE